MSHLVCPLCGKNAPLSTLDPESLDIDLRVVSFRGLGRGKGFAKNEEHSILGDDEYSPVIARRCLQLCYMFLKAGALGKNEVQNVLDIGPVKEQPGLAEVYAQQIRESQGVIVTLERQLREMGVEHVLREEVDYILREGVKLADPGCVMAEEDGWYLKLTIRGLELRFFLFLVMRKLPVKLKNRLIPRIKAEEDPFWYDRMLKDYPRKRSVMEKLLDADRVEIIQQRDGFGVLHEQRVESVPFVNRSENMISMEVVKKIVSDAKHLLNNIDDPETFKKILEG